MITHFPIVTSSGSLDTLCLETRNADVTKGYTHSVRMLTCEKCMVYVDWEMENENCIFPFDGNDLMFLLRSPTVFPR